ncbi:hypothetical protein V6B95_01745 [Thermoanaerobacterium saccharolyticum]|uniref:hypothetical protein n=1 Tax=Thermoanaerobacterium saccharolyticum TaxID=28896 RepID=UPI0005F0B150
MSNEELGILKDIIREIIQNLKEKDSSEFYEGKILAYNEVLSIIKDYLTGYDLKEFGLDIDIDNKYIIKLLRRDRPKQLFHAKNNDMVMWPVFNCTLS